MTPDKCRLANAATINVQLVDATLTVRAEAVDLGPRELGRIDLVDAGLVVHCALLACRGAGLAAASKTDVDATFALAFAPHTVIVDHAGGESSFAVGVAHALRNGESTGHNSVEQVEGPVIALPTPAGVDDASWADGGGVLDDAVFHREWDMSEPEPAGDGGPQAQRGRVTLPRPKGSGSGIFPGWTRRLQGALGRRPRPTEPDVTLGVGIEQSDEIMRSTPPDVPEAETTPADRPPDQDTYYPLLEAPDYFVVGEATQIRIGVSPEQNQDVAGGKMTVPPGVGDTYVLSVQLSAQGFELAGSTTSWVQDLAVTPHQRHPSTTMTIRAKPIAGRGKAALLQVIYTVADQVIGRAKRPVAIVTEPEAATEVKLPDVAVPRAMALPLGMTPADLTVVILTDESGPSDRLLWAFRTPHPVETPRHDCISDIGKSPQAFADALRDEAERAEGKPLLAESMRGVGRAIASAMHPEFWRIFKGVSMAAAAKPTVLFLSEEPYVPWELAVLQRPTFADDSRFLAAEAVTGRWLLAGVRQMPPPEHVKMKSMAVVYGDYTSSRLRKLVAAKAEMESLKVDFGATPVHATLEAVGALLHGAPKAEVLHFAIHGRFKSAGSELLMEDGAELTTFGVGGSNLGNAPFVFLNACQVGSSNELLGKYAGMAQAFLQAGASAVVAPLWSVQDDIAKDVSLRFYAEAFAGTAPAEILRRERAKFANSPAPTSATYLAYQFYGHPAFRLTK